MTFDPTKQRKIMGHFATGVTVITTLKDGKPAGMTASAVTSLSLDPVLLLVCINHKLPTHEAIEALNRSVTHTAYHIGQIVLLAKHLAGADWKSLSIPRGQSARAGGDFKTRGLAR